MPFAELGLPESIARAAQERGYTEATSIQSEAIPVLMSGRDLVGCSQTGTGKTAAFAMPLLAKIDLEKRIPQVLVLAPTRELAIQVAEAFEQYGSQLNKLRVLAVFGGAAYQPQLAALHRGVHVVVGTPGRLIDHVKQSALDLSGIHSLVLDEADEMLRMGFIDDVKWILSQTPSERQIALFSATMPGPIREIAEKHLNDPHSITVEKSQKVASTIRQQHLVVSPKHKVEMLARILELEQTDGVIVFVKTKIGTVELSERLANRGLNVAALNGDIPQAQRTRTVEKLKSGEIDILVATDVAARGLDVDRISHVINYDMPHDEEAYVHRIGRTGRAGREGAAILLVTPAQRHIVRSLQKATGQTIVQVDPPSIDAINEKRANEFKQRITLALESRQLPTFQTMIQQFCD
ncbi:MAG: DEAD/DEAH box helicase, partial [Planctomycetaceae bacterium]